MLPTHITALAPRPVDGPRACSACATASRTSCASSTRARCSTSCAGPSASLRDRAGAAARPRPRSVAGGLVRLAVLRLRPDAAVLRQRRHAGERADRGDARSASSALERDGAQAPAARAKRARSTSLAGVKFTDTEPLYGDAYGQVVGVAQAAQRAAGATCEDIVEAMRARRRRACRARAASASPCSRAGRRVSKPVRVRVRNDDAAELRAAADALLAHRARPSRAPRTSPTTTCPVGPQLRADAGPRGDARRRARSGAGGAPACGCTSTARSSRRCATRARSSRCACAPAPRGAPDIARILDDPVACRRSTRAGEDHHACARWCAPKRASARASSSTTTCAARSPSKPTSSASSTDTVAANDAIRAAWEKVAGALSRRPTLDFSGELDDIQESLDAMSVLFLLGVGLIYLILAAQFRSYWQPADDPGHRAAGLHRRGASACSSRATRCRSTRCTA